MMPLGNGIDSQKVTMGRGESSASSRGRETLAGKQGKRVEIGRWVMTRTKMILAGGVVLKKAPCRRKIRENVGNVRVLTAQSDCEKIEKERANT